MRRAIAIAAMTAAAFAGFGTAPASADDVCAINIVCTISGCIGLVNVCPTAPTCSGWVNVCPLATSCSGLVNVCDVLLVES